jgi:hypothetical protein
MDIRKSGNDKLERQEDRWGKKEEINWKGMKKNGRIKERKKEGMGEEYRKEENREVCVCVCVCVCTYTFVFASKCHLN